MSELEEQRFARPRVAAGVVFRDPKGRVLLVKPTYKNGWDLPGGYVETGESPMAAAQRELAEELSVSWPIGRLLALDWAPSDAEGDKLLFVFDGGVVSPERLADATLKPDEISQVMFHELAQLGFAVPERIMRRLHSVTNDGDIYLEYGRPIARDVAYDET